MLIAVTGLNGSGKDTVANYFKEKYGFNHISLSDIVREIVKEKGLDSSNVIYAGEVDSSNNIPSWSNQAGETHKNQFIVTSSDYITTLSDGGTHGNSFAAPRVAGAGALVRHKFPNLSGAQTATTILHTADDLGVAGVDAVYGHGKLNVGKALAPVGNLH